MNQSVAEKSTKYKSARLCGSFKFGADRQINEEIASIFAKRERDGDIVAVSSRGKSKRPEFCLIEYQEILDIARTADSEKAASVIIELRSVARKESSENN